MSAVDAVETEVRELVRRRGLDPAQDQAQMRLLIDEVVGHYDERALTSSLTPLTDPRQAARAVYDAVAGFGPLQRHLDDDSVEEIWINEPGRVFVARRGRSELTTTILAEGQVRDLVERMLKSSGRRIDMSSPFVDAMLPDGSRLHVVIPDITRRHLSVNIRKFVLSAHSLDELVELATLTPQAAQFLEAAVIAGLNIIVAGGTQAGKTTLLNCLAAAIPGRERVVTCEEVFELQVPLPDVVAMQTRQANLEGTGEIQLRRLVKEALRMRPDRILVGEVRQEECLDLLIALNSGLPGMCSIHANSAREAIVKMCTLPLLAGENVGHAFVVHTGQRPQRGSDSTHGRTWAREPSRAIRRHLRPAGRGRGLRTRVVAAVTGTSRRGGGGVGKDVGAALRPVWVWSGAAADRHGLRCGCGGGVRPVPVPDASAHGPWAYRPHDFRRFHARHAGATDARTCVAAAFRPNHAGPLEFHRRSAQSCGKPGFGSGGRRDEPRGG